MKYRAVSHAEFRQAARRESAPESSRQAPLHTEAFAEAAFILAATLAFVVAVNYALQVASIV